jgi:hypothetical protein
MAKFAKTTEIDISAMHDVIEEETPKRNKWFTIIPIIISVIVAFAIWMYVTENSSDINEVNFTVEVENLDTAETIELVASGTNSNLADFKKKDVKASYKDGKYIIVYSDGTLQQPEKVKNGKNYQIFTMPGITLSVD